jgi:hypothetical protein
VKHSKILKPLAVVGGSLLASSQAFAVSVVDAGVSTQISDTQTDIITVGGLVIGLAVVAMGIRWVKATFF